MKFLRWYSRQSLRLYYRQRRSWLGLPQRWLEGHPQFLFGPLCVVGTILGIKLAFIGGWAILVSLPLFILGGLMAVMLYGLYS